MDGGRLTPWERARSHTSLICLLQGLQGKITTVELRNECSVTGFIEHVNGHMDTFMKDVVFKDMFDVKTKMEKFYVKGGHIRFVIVPDDVDIVSTMQKRLKSLRNEGNRAPPAMETKGRGRGRGRDSGNARDKAQMKMDDISGRIASPGLNLMQKDKSKGKERFEAYMAGRGFSKKQSDISKNVKPKPDDGTDRKT